MKTRLICSALSAIGLGSAAAPALAVDAQLTLTIPEIQGSRVKRPYVAVWLERAGSQAFAGNVAVWYDMKKPNNVGATKWLPDLRSWWKVSGSTASFPIDGVSGATRSPGEHSINLGESAAVKQLAAGEYEVVVEVAREHGGHELVRLPLPWPPKVAASQSVAGKEELGTVRLSVKP